jgi:deoxyhypusine synthase
VIRDIDLDRASSCYDLLKQYAESGGFMAVNLAAAHRVLTEMFRDDGCTRFMSFTADLVATGTRDVLREIVERGLVDAVITTCGSLDHDLARCWGEYHPGSFSADDLELEKKGIHRLGNVFIDREDYGQRLEERLRLILRDLYEDGLRRTSPHELWSRIGSRIDDTDSILHWASKKGIPVVVPGPLDGAVGSHLWFFNELHRDFTLDLFEDQRLLSDLIHEASRSGALVIGGGISKHHLLWWNQFRGGLDYAVQITSAVPWDGSLSGAALGEAMTWGKISPEAKIVDVWGEATLLLPLVMKAVLERL